MSAESISQILLSVLFSSAAILAVFLTLGSRVEKQVVQKQTRFVIESLLQDAPLLGDAELPLTTYIKSLSPPDMTAEDNASNASNKSLMTKAIMMVVSCMAAGLIAVKMMASRAGFAFSKVLRQAMVACLLAAGTETAFLLCIAQHFISADPQAVRLMILEDLQKDAA